MKKLLVLMLLCSACALCAPPTAQAQARRIRTPPPAPAQAATAEALYTEAAGYTQKKLQEFVSKQVPYNPKLMEATLQQQRELAARHAAQVAARKNLAGADFYFLGLLYNLSGNSERAVEALRQFLNADKAAAGERPQLARYLVALRSAQGNNTEAAEAALADYLHSEPQKTNERINLEHALAQAYRKSNQPERALAHAEAAFKAAKLIERTPQNPSVADNALYVSSNSLVDIYRELKRPQEAMLAVLEEVRKLSLEPLSARLYTDMTTQLATLLVDGKRKPDAVKLVAEAISYVKANFKGADVQRFVTAALERKQQQLRVQGEAAPELTIDKWIEQTPLKISDLKGRVVLLDFWATWCGPCLASFPRLREWHEKYKDRGLVILGVTRYYGHGEGQQLSEAQELSFLERFKKQYQIPYGFAVADMDDNHHAYGVTAIPTAVLIDRTGVIRLLLTGSNASNETEISATIEKLLNEQ
ncbi:MAG TPA: TlpA disulfide reductase family protein [Pyrinomonadaceae bacterium]|jgi:thiol-disulfide isomerase/thioredoxin